MSQRPVSSDLQYETARTVAPSLSVVLQRNPGPMTLDGTNTWLLAGSDGAVAIDPGQNDTGQDDTGQDDTGQDDTGQDDTGQDDTGQDDTGHVDAIVAAAPQVALILVTHGHHDHVEAAAALHERCGAPVRAWDRQYCIAAEPLADGETIAAGGVLLRVLATPGHTADSVSFVRLASDGSDTAVFTGDTILGRGTTVVAHPDGALAPYLESLRQLRALGALAVYPGHGPELPALDAVAADYLEHREQRLNQIRDALGQLGDDASAQRIVEVVYAEVDRSVWWAAELSVQAQLDYLRAPGSN